MTLDGKILRGLFEQERLKPTARKEIGWKSVAAILHDALPKIDKELSQVNMPLASRKSKAFMMVCNKMLAVPDWKEFFMSETRGRIEIIINNWYRERYGKEFKEDEDAFFSALLIHGTPFIFRVPKIYSEKLWMG